MIAPFGVDSFTLALIRWESAIRVTAFIDFWGIQNEIARSGELNMLQQIESNNMSVYSVFPVPY